VLQADVPVYVENALRDLPHASLKALKDYLAAPN
jgi:hypothetical protein